MKRRLHSLLGLLFGTLLLLIASSGAILSVQPAMERSLATVPARGAVNVADLAAIAVQHYPGTEQIERLPSGAVLVYFTHNGNPGAVLIDPLTGEFIADYKPSAFFSWIKELHRAFLWDSRGRATVGVSALAMLILCFSGVFLLTSRLGGWKKMFTPIKSAATDAIGPRLHAELARAAMLGLVLSAFTGVWLSALRFDILTEAPEQEATFPTTLLGSAPAPIDTLSALQQVDLRDLHQLIFPFPNDPLDVYALRTHQGSGYIDQASGQWLTYTDYGNGAMLQTFIMELHTGDAYWWLGLLFGIAALTVPVLVVTGTMTWWQRRQNSPKLKGNAAAHLADTIVLVGSEMQSTWGFAQALHQALTTHGCLVHIAPMNQLAPHYTKARRLLILTATYGDGDAPASAQQFLQKLEQLPLTFNLPWAVLGFGDRQFERFCHFADQVSLALQQRQWPQLLATHYINRQSGQAFEQWGAALGQAIQLPLSLHYTSIHPATMPLTLYERSGYGEAVNAPTCILGFTPMHSGKALPHFTAGDLVGIIAPGSETPRFYSVASSSQDGILEICVRRHKNGLCSNFLCQLKLGGVANIFIQKNPRFKPCKGKTPIILIGAGTGIGPLIGFIRANTTHRPMFLYWGGRRADSDFLYQQELQSYLADQRLSQLHLAFSRSQQPAYVQDELQLNAEQLQELMAANAQILVCGGRQMATDVATTLHKIFLPLALNIKALKQQGRYVEDSY
ncbi:PepSY domain-containing protein [Alishewanella sp. HL-SH05]|uniref:PepSY domain-containing protein n=1 Tax=Alishewanella sp. HL-SH05 TaxID=3461145 RepID=UPI004041064F